MKHTVETKWNKGFAFEANVGGHKIAMDADESIGGGDSGARPKQLMLAALAGCTGIDVISILNKMRVEIEDFDIKIEADVTEEHPKHYNKMNVIYKFRGKDLDREKIQKTIELSQERYCGVSAVYKKAMTITYEIVLENS